MKTKHILTALALPAMFAACTAEDIVSENNALQQDARAKLSKDFVLNTNGEVESRYAVEPNGAGLKFNYEEGDLIGANLIDQYNPNPSVDVADWTILPYVAPSLPFKNIGGENWKSDAELGVGNYLFTYPFNSKDNSRAAAAFELPRIQKYDSENPNAIIEDNNKSVGAVTLYEGQTDANVSLKNIYTYPKFIINFDNGEEVTKVTKVVLKKTSEFAYKGGFDHKAVVMAFQAAQDIRENEDLTAEEKEEAIAAHWAALQTSDFIIDGVNDKTYDGFDLTQFGMAETTPYLIVEMDEAVKANAVTDNKSVEVRLMLPSVADMFGQGLSMHVVTDNGTYEVVFGKSLKDKDCDFVFKTDNDAKIKAALTRSASNTLRTKNLTLAADKSSDGNLGNIVTTAEDWNNLVKNTKGATKVVPVSILSDEFALTSELEMPKDKVTFSINTKVSVEGEVTLSNITATEIVVEEDAVLTTSPTLNITRVVTVKEGAELVFAPKYDDDDNLVNYTGVDKIVNYGTVTVPAGVEAKVNFKYDGSTNTFGNEKTGVLNVGSPAASRAAADAIAHLEGINKGTINNYSIINVPQGCLFNNYSSFAADYKWNEKAQKFEGVPTINNKGTFKSVGRTSNSGLVINNGTLSSNYKTSSTFNNYGELQIAKACPTFIDTNANGVIVLEDYKEAKLTINDAKDAADYKVTSGEGYRGTIRYTAAAKENEIDLSASMVNELIAEGNLKLTKTFTYTAEGEDEATVCELPNLIINADSKLTIPAYTLNDDEEPVYTAHVAKMTVKEEMTVTVDGTINAVDAIVLEKEAYLNIPVGATLAVAKTAFDFGSKSWVVVDGTLNFPAEDGDTEGNYANPYPNNIEVSKQGKITAEAVAAPESSSVTAAKLKDKKVEALQILVDAFLANSSYIKTNSAQGTWAEINHEDIVWTMSDAASNDINKTWVAKAVSEFLTKWNAISTTDVDLTKATMWATVIAEKALINAGVYNGYDGSKVAEKNTALKAAYVSATSASNMKASIKEALGNAWIKNGNAVTVYTKTFDGQAITEITDVNGNKMVDAYKTAVEALLTNPTEKLSNTQYLAWKEMVAKKLDGTTAATKYPAVIQTAEYIDAESYIEAYEGSNLYNDLKLYKDLSDKYAEAGYKNLKAYKFDAATLSVDTMTKFFNAIYTYANADDVNVLYKNDEDVKKVTEAKVVATSKLTYFVEQLQGMANAFPTYFAKAPATNN